MTDAQVTQRVKHLKAVIYDLYRQNLKTPFITGSPLRDVKVQYYDSDREWNNAHRNRAGPYSRKLADHLRANQPRLYNDLLAKHGSRERVVERLKENYINECTIPEGQRGTERRPSRRPAPIQAYYDSLNNTIVTRTKDLGVLAHELIEACGAREGVTVTGMPKTRFEARTSSALKESLATYIAYEVTYIYLLRGYPEGPDRTTAESMKSYLEKLLSGAKTDTTDPPYSIEPARRFLRTHGREKGFHAYFSGSFKKTDQGKWVPAIPSTGRGTELRRPLQRPATGFRGKATGRTTQFEPLMSQLSGHLSREYARIAPTSYTVKRGDTFPKIAGKFGVANQWKTLKTHNPHVGGTKHTRLPTGQKLTIPTRWSPGRIKWWDGASKGGTGATIGGVTRRHDGRVGTFDYRYDEGVGGGIGSGRGRTVRPNWMKPRHYREVSLEPKSRRLANRGGVGLGTSGSLDGSRASDWLRLDGTLQPKRYTIKPNDTLSGIASKFGHASQWRTLYNLNRGTIGDNPHLIHPDRTLVIPADWRYGGSY